MKKQEIELNSPITDIKGIGPKKAEAFKRLGIFCIEDSLYLYPRSYQDFRNPTDISECKNDDKILIIAKILLVNKGRGYGRKQTLHLLVEDKTGRMEVLFFMAGYMQKAFSIGEEYSFFGKVKVENGRVTMFHPDFSVYDSENKGIYPVYPLVKGISQKDVRKLTEYAFTLKNLIKETLPESVIKKSGLCSNSYALENIHYPKDENAYKTAKFRLVYEELFDLKAALALTSGSKKSNGLLINSGMAERFVDDLPYKLTNAQNRVLAEVLNDIRSPRQMKRLVQGDVGSGKTAVAMAALSEVVFAGFQGLFMAPTDILARQHFESLKSAFSNFDVNIVLLTSSISAKERKESLKLIESGVAQIVIGTHALLSETVRYKNVGLVITDEQHRFGVNQRKNLSQKGTNPDVLIMTATPIPRTLAVVLYADMDVSKIDELPPGRKEIKTFSFKDKDRKDAYKLMFEEIKKGHQAYIVAPFIEDSESTEGRSAESLYNSFIKKHPEISCGILHGDLSQDEKDEVMTRFVNGEISVLISTVVIEVGIDVPNATVIIIENSERFGLSQMHQLRGRVGRGKDQSYCLICSGNESEISKERTEILCSTNDGFIIAEKDLEIRGPGEFFGYKQHGLPQLILADPIRHSSIAEKAGKNVSELLKEDPDLSKQENAQLYEVLKKKYLQVDNLTI